MNTEFSRSQIGTARLCAAGLVGIAVVVLLIADARGEEPASQGGQVVALAEYDLLSRADTLEPRPYWVGRQPGVDRFELEVDADGNSYVRYMTEESAPEKLLTVATYAVPEAQARLERAAKVAGESDDLSHGNGLTTFAGDGDSAYVAFDELPEVQVEVYSPKPGVARDLVLSGAVTPLHWTPLG